jgi:HD-like signal output (HDOD) protein
LRLTNSAYRGLPSDIANPVEAVNVLGLETIKALVMTLQFLAERRQLKPGYLSLDQLWQHSVAVGQIARDLILFEKKDHLLASQALVAGLVHDLGKAVLATNFDDLYGRVHSLARKQPVSLWDIEKEMFGANHGEIGACLVGMWNLPSPIVEAAALHHEPPLGEQETLTPLAAVHIANVLAHQLQPDDEDPMVAAVINTPFLNELGLLGRLPIWHAVFANRVAGKPEPEVEEVDADLPESEELSSTTTSGTANHLKPDTATRTGTSGARKRGETTQAPIVSNRKHWVYAAVAAGALALLALWLRTEPEFNAPEAVYASTPAHYGVALAFSPTAPPQTVPAAVPEASPTPAVSEIETTKPTPTPPATESQPAASQPAPESVTEASVNSTPTNVPPPAPQPQEKPKPYFRLNGIIYNSAHPFAIVNGETVSVGDKVNAATVVGIGQSTVTLEFKGQRKVLELRY